MKRIRELREARDMTQAQLGELVGVRQCTIDKYENDRITPPLNRTHRIAEFFHVSIDYLMERTDNPGGL